MSTILAKTKKKLEKKTPQKNNKTNKQKAESACD